MGLQKEVQFTRLAKVGHNTLHDDVSNLLVGSKSDLEKESIMSNLRKLQEYTEPF